MKKLLLIIVIIFLLGSCSVMLLGEDEGPADFGDVKEANCSEYEGNGTWTILVYLCGSDLESNYGSATADIKEMLKYDTGDDMRFVIETGGAKTWLNNSVSNRKIQRYEIQNGEMRIIDSLPNEDMGKAQTFYEFLRWGINKYDKGKLGVVLWDHGGGSIDGACFDENYKYDSLTLNEMDAAFKAAMKGKKRQLNFVGFDACLMSTVETADMLSKYASFMIASEELESGYGWDYSAIADAIYEEPEISTPELGKVICDSFYQNCYENWEGSTATLSVTDLCQIDEVVDALDDVAYQANSRLRNNEAVGEIFGGARATQNYGANSPSEGYSNMIDLGNLAVNIKDAVDSQRLSDAVDNAVLYQIYGYEKAKSTGLSIYYPLTITDINELYRYSNVSVSNSYKDLVYACAYGSGHGTLSGYRSGVKPTESAEIDIEEEYFETSAANQIEFSEDLHLNDDDYYTFTIAEDSIPLVSSISYYLYMKDEENDATYYIGSDDSFDYDSETGVVTEQFEGYWPCLPDGTLLAMYVVDQQEDFTTYSAPIYLNGEYMNLRFTYDYDKEEWQIIGAWKGTDEESGTIDKELIQIEEGDVIIPVQNIVNEDGSMEEIKADPYTVDSDFNIVEMELDEGSYEYKFNIQDVFGNSLFLDGIDFKIDENGDITV